MPKRFWLPEDHHTELAQRHLSDFGWSPTANSDWDLAWTLDMPAAGIFAMAESGRWLNHIRGVSALSVKSHLCVTLREGAARATSAGVKALFDFVPETYVLPGEWNEWENARTWNPDAIWIQKPADMSRGRGVALITDPAEVKFENLVVQRYIANPHLIDGYKYSLRFYVLIASVDPLIAYLFEDGFTKFASRPFSLSDGHRADRFRHLTNPDILRDDPQAAAVSERNMTHRAYRRHLADAGIDNHQLWHRIRRLLAATIGAALPFMRGANQSANGGGRGQFELLGVDLTIDDQLKPWLLECNLGPSLAVEASATTGASRDEYDIKSRVVHDTLRIVGAADVDVPCAVASNIDEARSLLSSLDERRGGFERLWPSSVAIESLAGADRLSPLDVALLEDEAAAGFPPLVVNGVDEILCGADTLIYQDRNQRLTLLDGHEVDAWRSRRGIDFVRWGWLAPADCVEKNAALVAEPSHPRGRSNWNRERVYTIHGVRIAVGCATPQQEEAIDRAMAWYETDHEQVIDARMFVARRTSLADALASLHRIALKHHGGLVRRRLRLSTDGGRHVLSIGEPRLGDADVRHVIVGGSPFGAWVDEGGRLAPVPITHLGAENSSKGEVLLDLLSDGPGVVHAFDAAAIRSAAAWVAATPIVAINREEK